MGSYTQLTYHIIYATKYRRRSITKAFREELYEYIGGTLRKKKGSLIEIGGVEDHLHLLARLSATAAVADTIRDLKANSSKWVNARPDVRRAFEWQIGYSAFSVSFSQIETVREYIQDQQEHHKTMSFQEEYMSFLKRHGIEFKPENLFEGELYG